MIATSINSATTRPASSAWRQEPCRAVALPWSADAK
jgi:hypothetical protein